VINSQLSVILGASIPECPQIANQRAHVGVIQCFAVSRHLSFNSTGDYLVDESIPGAQFVKICPLFAARVEPVAFDTVPHENSATFDDGLLINVPRFYRPRLPGNRPNEYSAADSRTKRKSRDNERQE